MKKLLSFILLIIITATTISCERVMEVKTKDDSGKLVIEATISSRAGDCKALISKTTSLQSSNTLVPVSDANVSIQEVNGVKRSLTETSAGNYTHTFFKGTPGKTYLLEIEYEGATYTASCTMPTQVPIVNVYTEKESFFGNINTIVQLEYNDPPGIANFYRAVEYVNGKKEDKIFIRSDEYSDGKLTRLTIRNFYDEEEEDKKIKTGDLLTIELLCIAPEVYKFWETLESGATGGGASASPANPISNISGNVLGYFSAHTYEKVEFEVK